MRRKIFETELYVNFCGKICVRDGFQLPRNHSILQPRIAILPDMLSANSSASFDKNFKCFLVVCESFIRHLSSIFLVPWKRLLTTSWLIYQHLFEGVPEHLYSAVVNIQEKPHKDYHKLHCWCFMIEIILNCFDIQTSIFQAQSTSYSSSSFIHSYTWI